MADKSFKDRLGRNRALGLIANQSRLELGRGSISRSRGYHFTGVYPAADRKRQVWDQFGYPEVVDEYMLFEMYSRNAIAKAVVELVVDKCWQDSPIVMDGDDDQKRRKDNPSEFEKALDKFAKEQHLWQRCKGLDERQRVHRYGGLIIEAKDGQEPSEPIKRRNGLAISNLKPVYESQIEVNTTYQDRKDPRYGQPKHFDYRTHTVGSRNIDDNDQFPIDPSRVIIWAEGADDGSIYGVPVLTSCYNALMDLDKTRGAFAEGGYKNSKGGFVFSLNREDSEGLSSDQFQVMTNNVNSYYRSHNGGLVVAGGQVHTLQTDLVDPSSIYALAANECAAAAKAPWTVIVGQQTGRLASDEDQSTLAQNAEARRETFLNSAIESMLWRFIEIGALPRPKGDLHIAWPSLQEPGEKDKAEVANLLADVSKKMLESGQPVAGLDAKIAEIMELAQERGEELPDPAEGLGNE